MQLNQRISAFVKLGQFMGKMTTHPDEFSADFDRIYAHNKWFGKDQVLHALSQWSVQLNHDDLTEWTAQYAMNMTHSKTIALVLAGNLPLVGFHDILTALISGHRILCKTSSKDPILTRLILDMLAQIEPGFVPFIDWSDGPLANFDAVIATGSNNSAFYFEQYFKNYPNIIRKSRTSVAVLTGQETPEDLNKLTRDVFTYFGLGCRSVSKIYVPEGYDFQPFFGAAYTHKDLVNHDKYMNNYDYNKAVYLMGQIPLLDNEFLLLKEDPQLSSPIAVLFYEYYDNLETLSKKISNISDEIQCVVGQASEICSVDFGQTQCPGLWDYADGINSMNFVNSL